MNQLTPLLKRAEASQNRPQVALLFKDAHLNLVLERELSRHYRVNVLTGTSDELLPLALDGCDAVLMDLDVDAQKVIRALPRAAGLPLVAVLPSASRPEMLSALEAGFNDCVSWPNDADILRLRLRALVVNKQHHDAEQAAMARLKASVSRKDRFLHIVTHDLKNPLNSIKLAHYILRTHTSDLAAAAEPLHTIETSVNSMNDLIMDFLESAALESGHAELQTEAIVMEESIWEVIFRHGPTANAKNITLLMGETEGVVQADPRRLSQIMNNLVSNAIKYSPHDRFVTISSVAKGGFIRISVADEGAGIPESERASLYEPFTRTSSQPTGGESSTGLGLWIVKELVTLHGGTLGYEAMTGGGSTFWVELPAQVEFMEAVAV